MRTIGRVRPDAAAQADLGLIFERLASLEALIAGGAVLPIPERHFDEQHTDRLYSNSKLAEIAAAIYRSRRRRPRFFANELFAEPAWDMLLDLFVSKALGRRISTSSLCLAADVPPTTALRWIDELEECGLLQRHHVAEDQRLVVIEMTKSAFELMCGYVAEGIERHDMPAID